ncbi:alpha/beta fold hydrolase [Neotabrizicola shimadae]|uniref:Alpha/beta hydrolase n=1 Tax=Neotabrizicola shimadae TaxID=2807096 RepID=A0A8G0ZSB5_9RHOB|nr:alpha/beta hydrolase [Neotabrizicola shimadae]QYZ68570.1 alpha/beta hydrolase [Neotabrizicola shimadae]
MNVHAAAHSPDSSTFAEVGPLSIHVETFGDRSRPAVLLVMGNSAPGLVWPDSFCQGLAERGVFVVRFDQRDTGLSSHIDFEAAPYTLGDLAVDAIGVLDALDLRMAHVVGLSQGGSLACLIALTAPERVASLTLLMSSLRLGPKNAAFAGAAAMPGDLPRPAADYVAKVIALNSEAPRDEAETARQFVENFRLAKGPDSPFDEGFWADLGARVAALALRRADGLTARMANNSNHRRAQMATPDIPEAALARIGVPVLVIHGGGDPIFPPGHAEWTAQHLPGAVLQVLPEMGHALDPAFFDEIIEQLAGFFDVA